MPTPKTWIDGALWVLGLYLIVTPSFTSTPAPAIWVAEIGGLAVLGTAIGALMRARSAAAEWTQVVLGALVLIAPFALSFTDRPSLAWNAAVVGAVIVLLALVGVSLAGRPAGAPARPVTAASDRR